MSSPSPDRVARELQTSLGLLIRRLRQVRVVDDLSQPESTALASLVRNAPATSADLARIENISAQSMHATITTLEQRGLVSRSADAADGRRMLVDLTDAGRALASRKRDARAEQFAGALAEHFTADERATLHAAAPLLERLAKAL
jgi:DNA-binding MarR family transcriptional regulator